MRPAKGGLFFLGALSVAEAFVVPSSRSSAFTSNSHHGFRNSIQSSPTGLSMMFDQLSSAIGDIAKSFGPKQKMTEKSIAPALRDVRRALLDADVNIQVADSLIEGVKKRALGKVVTEGVTADQQFIKNMYDELLDMMGGDSNRGKRPGDTSQSTPAATLATGTAGAPAIILLAGLQGAGKTTAAGKLALFLKEREVDYAAVAAMDPKEVSQTLVSRLPKTQRKVLLAAADVYRPAAIKQLQILGESIDVDVFTMGTDADPVEIALQAVSKAKAEGYDTVIVDTAGRQIIDDTLMEELRRIQQAGMYTRNLASSPIFANWTRLIIACAQLVHLKRCSSWTP
jgi:signal recognition particle subunit SRP54